MKLKECISLAASILNLDGVLSSSSLTDTDKLLIRCANSCLDEIASEYLPLKTEKEVYSTNGQIPYSLLGEAIYDVIGVSKDGAKVKYELMPSYIKVDKDGRYTVRFCTRPPELLPDDDLPIWLHLSPRIVAYGTAAEYLLFSGFYEEAVTWDQRFKDAIARAAYGGGEKRIKLRRWLE